MSDQFPVLRSRWRDPQESIPWSVIAPHERQALRNHSQTLRRLAERGGLAWTEMLAVLTDSYWEDVTHDRVRAKDEVLRIVAAATSA